MRSFLITLTVACAFQGSLAAHTVVYRSLAGEFSDTNNSAYTLARPYQMAVSRSADGMVLLVPFQGESCVVAATLEVSKAVDNPPVSIGSNAPPGGAVSPGFTIKVQREPDNGIAQTFFLYGSWHATGMNGIGMMEADCTGKGDIFVQLTVTGALTVGAQEIAKAIAEQPNAATIGDPVSTSTGEVIADSTDLALGGPLPLSFRRHYGSLLNTSSGSSLLGTNWMHNFDSTLVITGTTATVLLFPGKVVSFQQTGVSWQLASAEPYNYQLVASPGTFQFLDPGTGLTYSFSGSGALTGIRDRNGNTLTVTQGPVGPVSVSDGLGRTLTFTYMGPQSSGYSGPRLASVADQTGRRITFTYTATRLTGVTDSAGRTTTYTYAASGSRPLLSSTVLPAGNTPWTQTFDASGLVVRQADSGANATSIGFDQPAPGMRQIIDPLGRVTTHTYDAAGNLIQLTDAAGKSLSFTYDNNKRLISRTDRLGNKTAITYQSPSGYPASVTDAAGSTTTFTYTGQNQGAFNFYNLTKIAFPDGTSLNFTYDSSGNILSRTDQAGKVTTYTYNARGQLLTSANPAGGVTAITYNSDGTASMVKSPAGDVTTYTYDAQKRPVKVQFGDNTSRSFAWDAADNLVSITDERGKTVKLAYNANHKLESATDALNQSRSYAYDTDELQISETDPLGHVSRFAYDAVGALTSFTNAAGERTAFGYDSLNRLQSVSDPAGEGPSFTYDAEGRLSAITDALANRTSLTTDALGRTTLIATGLSETIGLTYDALGRVTSVTDPLAIKTAYGYNSRGLLASVILGGGVGAAYTWDDLGVITNVTDPNGNVWTYSNDSMGRLKSRTDPLGRVTTNTYDARNRVSGMASPIGSVAITYDAAGNIVRRLYSDGTDLKFTYDDNNRLTGANGLQLGYDAAGRITLSNGLVIRRDDAGRAAAVTYAPGKTVTYTRDTRGLLSRIADWAGGVTSFTYDAARRLISITRANGVSTQYTYDANGRTSGITDQSGAGDVLAAITLQRDAAGRTVSAERNLPQQPVPAPGTLPLAYDAAHQIGGATYDALGRLTNDGFRQYTWDLASRLTTYTGVDGTASFSYDGLGQRISRTGADGATVVYVLNYGLDLPSVATLQSGGLDARYYVYLPDGALLYSIDAANNSRSFYSFDEAGSTTLLTDDSGSVMDAYGITPFGETVTQAGSSDNPFTFHGRYGVMQEPGTSLYYMRARYYDSTSQRFLSRDPILSAQPLEINPYQFARNNPLSFSDPTGRKVAQSDVLMGAIAAAWNVGLTAEQINRQTELAVIRRFNRVKEELSVGGQTVLELEPLSGDPVHVKFDRRDPYIGWSNANLAIVAEALYALFGTNLGPELSRGDIVPDLFSRSANYPAPELPPAEAVTQPQARRSPVM